MVEKQSNLRQMTQDYSISAWWQGYGVNGDTLCLRESRFSTLRPLNSTLLTDCQKFVTGD